MSRLIREEDVIREIDKWLDNVGTAYVGKGLSYYGELLGCISDAPTVDAVPVVHGKWLYNGFVKEWECSECHSSISLSDDRNSHPNFCPRCGAKMDGKKVQE